MQELAVTRQRDSNKAALFHRGFSLDDLDRKSCESQSCGTTRIRRSVQSEAGDVLQVGFHVEIDDCRF